MSEWSSTAGVAQDWLHGLALVKANHTSSEPSEPSYAEAMRRLHGPSGVWTDTMGNRLGELGLPIGDAMEYDPMRGCKFWNPMTCYTAPSFMSTLIGRLPASSGPLFILEVRPFLGAATIALANALAYKERSGFILAADTWRGDEAYVGLHQGIQQYIPPSTKTDLEAAADIMYFQFLRNAATAHVSSGGFQAAWVPRPMRGTAITNATKQIVPFPLQTSKAKATAHWLGRKGWRPNLVYVNAPRAGVDSNSNFKLDLEHAWKILGCAGALAGDGYRVPEVTEALREFAQKHKVVLEAFFVRAAGTRYEQTWPWEDSAEFAARIANFPNTNFTTWTVSGKPCKDIDDSLPQVDSALEVPGEYLDIDSALV